MDGCTQKKSRDAETQMITDLESFLFLSFHGKKDGSSLSAACPAAAAAADYPKNEDQKISDHTPII
jgi:hypothetical protein